MNRKIAILLSAALAFAGGLPASAQRGDSMANADSVTMKTWEQSGRATLVPESMDWFGGMGFDFSSFGFDMSAFTSQVGVYYIKFTAEKGHAYSVWLTGNSSLYTTISTDLMSGGAQPPYFTDYVDSKGQYYKLVRTSDWTEVHPETGTYYIQIRGGSVGESVQVHWMEGLPMPEGTYDNPIVIVPSNPAKEIYGTLTDGKCYYQANLTAGRMYRFKTLGGAADKDAKLEVGAATIMPPRILEQEETEDKYNPSWLIVPSVDGVYQFLVSSENATKIGLSALAFKSRAAKDHTDIIEIKSLDGWSSVPFQPDRVNAKGSDYYDDVMDSNLFSFSLKAGERVVFETQGAQTNLLLRIFDAAGKTLVENTAKASNSYECRVGFEAEQATTYYVGVAQNLLDDRKDPVLDELVVLKTVPSAPVAGSPDASDPMDDTYAGANALSAVVAGPGDDPREVDSGLRPTHQLSATDWEDVFAIGARKGITYRLKAATATTPVASLGAKVFYFNGSKEVEVQPTAMSGSIDPEGKGALEFRADYNGMYYIHVYNAVGKGLDYPTDYTMHASAYSEEEGLRLLTVYLVGPSKADNAYWQLGSDTSSKYASGASVLVTGTQVIRFASSNRELKNPANVTLKPEDPAELTVYFTDTADPKDDVMSGATSLSFAATEKTASRTLYVKDDKDHFTFTAVAGTYYNFALKDVTADAVFSIVRDAGGAEVFTDRTSLLKQTFDAGKYYLIVHHANPLQPEDGSYALAYSAAKVGELKLAKDQVSVKEDAAYVDVQVNRTAKEGRVRVRFGTFADTAMPGREYVATNGVLEWANGDSKAKTIRVKLIPDVIAAWEENKIFKVQLREIPAEELADDEYPILVSGAHEAVITLTETAKKTPGTIQVAGVSDVKKPVITIKAGETAEIALERVLGANGVVGVSVVSVKGTANKNGETDFEPISREIAWVDGESGKSSPIAIVTKKADGDFTGTKTFTLKLTALKSKSKTDPTQFDNPTIAASTITVNIVNDKYVQNVTDFAKTLPKESGVALKEGKKDSWFWESGDEFYSVVSRKFTGPSRLWWGPSSDPFRTNMFVSAKGETVTMRTGDVYTNDLLQAATPAAPTVDKAVVAAGDVNLAFDRLPDDEKREIGYRVYILENGAKVLRPGARSAVNLKLGDPETEIVRNLDGDYVTNVLWTSANQGKYTWRVDSFFIGGTVTNTAKSAWSFTVLKEAETGAVLTVGGKDDVYSDDLNLGVMYELKVAGADVKSFTTVSGTKLPDGLKLEQDKGTTAKPGTMDWYVRGYPTKAGDFQAVIQATYVGSPAKKSPTYVLNFHVNDLVKPVALAPTVDKAVVTPGTVQLCFSRQKDAEYKVYFKDPDNKGTLGKVETLVTDPDFKVEVAPGAKCTWKVVANYPGQDAKARAVESATFNLTGATLGKGGAAYLTKLEGEDAYGASYAEGTTMVLRQRLAAAFRIDNYVGDVDVIISSAKLVSGKLPDGLKVEQNKYNARSNPTGDEQWYVRGSPTKAGTFQAIVQATFAEVSAWNANGTPKTKKEFPAATVVMDFVVEAVDAPADLSFTLTGPGRFIYTATDARIPEGRADKTATLTNFISKSSETLKLSDVERLHAYEYVKLDAVTPAAPTVDKASVRCGSNTLWFERLPNDAENGIDYVVYLLGKGEKAGTRTLKLGDPETIRAFNLSGAYGTADVELGFGTSYTWRVDSFFVGGPVTNVAKTVWTLNTVAANAFETELKGAVLDNRDAYGHPFEDDRQKLLLCQGVAFDWTVGIAAGSNKVAAVKLAGGKLPDGLKIVQDKPNSRDDSTWTFHIRGVPTKVGAFQAVVQTSYGTKSPCTTTALNFEVRALDSAIGTFNGILVEDGAPYGSLTNGFPAIGTVQLTVSAAGKLSAKVALAGKSYSFAKDGFDYLEAEFPLDNGGYERTLSAGLPLVQKIGTVAYTNRMNLVLTDGVSTDLFTLGDQSDSLTLTMNIQDAKGNGVQEKITYQATLTRDNTKNADYLKAFQPFVGYYTVSLPALAPEYGKPQGNGYVTVTLDKNGKSKVAGMLADGTSVSCSLMPALLGDLTDPESCEVIVPVYLAKSPAVFGGELHINFVEMDGEMVPVADPGQPLYWFSDNAAATYWGDEGWKYELFPAGGWYDTVVNLQAYYLSDKFSVDAGYSDDLPRELLADGYEFVASTMPSGQAVDVVGNTVSVEKQVQVKDADKLIDFTKTVNPSNVKVTFNRATGIVNGDFSVWTEGLDRNGKRVQKAVSGFKHQGVLILSRDPLSILGPSVWTAGYFLAPKATLKETTKGKTTTRSYTASYPFNIMAEDQGKIDWCEPDWNPACSLPE